MSDYGRDRGQALPWMMMVVAAAMTLVVVAVRLAIVVDDAARARTAADAAALAGAAAGEPAARDLAERNGAELSRSSARGAVCESRCGRRRPGSGRGVGIDRVGAEFGVMRPNCSDGPALRRGRADDPLSRRAVPVAGCVASAHGRCLAAVRSRRSSRRPRREGALLAAGADVGHYTRLGSGV